MFVESMHTTKPLKWLLGILVPKPAYSRVDCPGQFCNKLTINSSTEDVASLKAGCLRTHLLEDPLEPGQDMDMTEHVHHQCPTLQTPR